jgi:hypothetical protein
MRESPFQRLDAAGCAPRLSLRIEQERAAYDAILRRLTVLHQKGLFEPEAAQFTWKGINLVGLFASPRERIANYSGWRKKAAGGIAGPFSGIALRRAGRARGIYPGPAMKELSLIRLTLGLPEAAARRAGPSHTL